MDDRMHSILKNSLCIIIHPERGRIKFWIWGLEIKCLFNKHLHKRSCWQRYAKLGNEFILFYAHTTSHHYIPRFRSHAFTMAVLLWQLLLAYPKHTEQWSCSSDQTQATNCSWSMHGVNALYIFLHLPFISSVHARALLWEIILNWPHAFKCSAKCNEQKFLQQ